MNYLDFKQNSRFDLIIDSVTIDNIEIGGVYGVLLENNLRDVWQVWLVDWQSGAEKRIDDIPGFKSICEAVERECADIFEYKHEYPNPCGNNRLRTWEVI